MRRPGPHQAGRRFHTKGWYVRKSDGYVEEWVAGRGYVKQHRLVMERMLGRSLERFEHVHHRNGNRADNREKNLELWVSPRQPMGQRASEKHCPSCSCFA